MNNFPSLVISGLLVQLIGIDEGQYTIWEQMELSQHSVLIHCRSCGRSVPVDRQEHEETKTLICPLPNCNHSWCKACQQPINSEGPPHSCDGTAELDDLMQRQGWKYCPSMSPLCYSRVVTHRPWQTAEHQSRGMVDAAI
jgi:hypothetical protein